MSDVGSFRNASIDPATTLKEFPVIPNSVYDIVTTVNREFDLRRPPVREYYHSFGADGAQPTQGDAHLASPGFFARLTLAFRALAGRRSKTESVQAG